MDFEIFVNGTRVRVWELPYGWGLSVDGNFWGAYTTVDVAVHAACAVLEAPKFAA